MSKPRTTKTTTQSPVLSHSRLTDAHEALLALDAKYGLIPQCARPAIHDSLDRLLAAAAENNITTLNQVIDRQKEILAAVTGVAMGHQQGFLDTESSEVLHTHRNLLLCLCLAGVMDYNGDAAEIATAFPALKQRTAQQIRHHADDEVALMRLWVLRMSTGTKNNQRAAAVFAQTDAGLSATETTRTTFDDVDLTPGNAMIYAPGHQTGIAARVLPLEAFHIHVLDRYLSNLTVSETELLTYRPRGTSETAQKAATAASASVACVIERIRAAVGLKHPDLTAASVPMWRVVTVMRTHDSETALTASGRSSLANLNEVLWHGTRGQTKPLETNRKKRTLDFNAA